MSPNRESAAPAAGSRRRGAALEAAVLEAAWDELVQVGYHALTLEGVANRAHTSRPVLARRWSTRAELVLAAMNHRTPPVSAAEDTGALRSDVLALLRSMKRRYGEIAGVVGFLLAEYQLQSRMSLAELREQLLARRGPGESVMAVILDRAAARGELDRTRIPPRVESMAVDLMRHELLMHQGTVSEQTLEEIVDELFLPLVRATAGTDVSSRAASR